jgi:pimeloyl-ACP methyl ester carboxylesterase
MNAQHQTGADLFVTAPDGLRLHVRRHGHGGSGRRPVICLPGLARTAEDFDSLATALANDPDRPHLVLAIDSRGRGQSDYDRNPANYTIATELADLLAVLTALEVAPAVFVGTSRGGLLTMLLATMRPTAIAGVVLNDIGPVIETKGLVRIKSYVGRLPQPKSFNDAEAILQRLFGPQFPKLSPEQWARFARQTFAEQDGTITPRYDPKLARILSGVRMARPLPALWHQFDALAGVPLMVIRGANSDILSAATVAAMGARRPNLVAIEIPDQGHAPLLDDRDTLARIGEFIAMC